MIYQKEIPGIDLRVSVDLVNQGLTSDEGEQILQILEAVLQSEQMFDLERWRIECANLPKRERKERIQEIRQTLRARLDEVESRLHRMAGALPEDRLRRAAEQCFRDSVAAYETLAR